MSAQGQFWVLIVALALGTWLMRSLPIMLHGHVPHPAWLERFLKHVPVAALTALVIPSSIYVHSGATYTIAPTRILAAGIAMFVALRTKNVLATLVVGMAVLWVGQWGLSALG
jgi:branched-subunit amino acid transport protein